MQYQIFALETGELVAWLDTKTQDAVLKRVMLYSPAKDLRVQEVIEDGVLKSPKTVAEFEKVSWGQYCDAHGWNPGEVFTQPENTKEYDGIKIPVRKTKHSAGYDFFAPTAFTLEPGETITIATGIKCQIDKGYFLALFPRSGQGFKYRVRLENTVGIIDGDYYNNVNNEGHIFIKITNEGHIPMSVKQGDAFCQGIFLEFFLAKEELVTAERVGGLGSTSK